MLDARVVQLLNEQINKEFYSAYLYLDMAVFYDAMDLDGYANYYMIQAQEERDHALLFMKYMQSNGYKVTLEAIAKICIKHDLFVLTDEIYSELRYDGEEHTIIGVKENNGILKIYVNGTLAGSAYKAENRYFNVPAAAITIGELAKKTAVYDIAFGYDELDAADGPVSTKIEGIVGEGSSVDTSEAAFDKSVGNAFDGDYSTFWATVEDGTLEEDFLIADLNGEYTINKVAYTKRFDSGAQYNCTGNLLDYVIEVSTDGETWNQVAAGDTVDGTTVITFEPVQATHVRLTATRSHHWNDAMANTVMTVAELEVFEYIVPVLEPDDDSRDICPQAALHPFTTRSSSFHSLRIHALCCGCILLPCDAV